MTERADLGRHRPVALIVLDGWGIYKDYPGNAVRLAKTPNADRWMREFPYTELAASGRDVGLPAGQMGNSEVGHLNLGAGFVVHQWITRLDQAIEDGSFFRNEALVGAVEHAKRHGGALHTLGLLGNGGVHASDNHLKAVLRLAHDRGLERVYVHAFTDGRDTPPESGLGFMRDLETYLADLGTGRVATVSGRYYAMDRDRRWDRVAKAYDAIVLGEGKTAPSATAAIEASYKENVTDEFIVPTVVTEDGRPVATIGDNDAVIYTNFRNDRARQLTRALTDPDFDGFRRAKVPRNLYFVSMVRYEDEFEERFGVHVAFPPRDVTEPIARVVAQHGLSQFHCAETEKYAHVTFFYNGGREDPFPKEDRTLVPSPKVPTYDLQPEMSAPQVADTVVAAVESGKYDFIVVNFANPDMVGHTGVLKAAIVAVETVDACAQRVLDALLARGGVAIVTADHGNAEVMIDEATGGPHTAHTTNPVPLWLATPEGDPLRSAHLRSGGRLADVAPTLLALLGVPPDPSMTGKSLIEVG
jgi:2,3-bisphosphoglycerate-independent phosphoglycerate mutase